MSVIFFSLSCLSSSLKLKTKCIQSHYNKRTALRLVGSTLLSPVHHRSYLDGWTNIRIPRVVITSFFFPPLSKAMLKTAELPALCEVSSSISQLFVPYFAMSAFTCIYLQHRINSGTRRSNSSQFSWLFIVWNNNFDLIANCSSV